MAELDDQGDPDATILIDFARALMHYGASHLYDGFPPATFPPLSTQLLAANLAEYQVASLATVFAALGHPTTPNAAENLVEIEVIERCTIRQLIIVTTSAQPANNKLVAMVRKNGGNTTLTLEIAANAVAARYSDLVHSFVADPGDRIALSLNNTDNANPSAKITRVSVELAP